MNRSIMRATLAAFALACGATYAEEPPTSPAPAEQAAPAAAAPAAVAPAASTEPAAKPAPAADTGTIIFFRPKKFIGAAMGFIVREGDKELGKLRNGKYFTIHAAAGKHDYVVHSEAKDVLTLEVDPGETYYVQGTLTVGILAGRPNLSPSDQATFESMKSSLTMVDPLAKE
jgi:pyruvate/2-oxoglutarate dehydrogenase complex dihydrolipoamide acyltransferase (E2) component